MRKKNIMIPNPNSNFISVGCPKCEKEMIVFTYTTNDINCSSCGELLAKKTGSKANILGKVLIVLD
jgi:small subunit ribosomal protein S27e